MIPQFRVALPAGCWKAFSWSNWYLSQVVFFAYFSVLVSGRRGGDHHHLKWCSLYLDHIFNIYKGLSEMESEWMIKKQMSKKWWIRWIEIPEKNNYDIFQFRKKSLLKITGRALRRFSVLYFLKQTRGRTRKKKSLFFPSWWTYSYCGWHWKKLSY